MDHSKKDTKTELLNVPRPRITTEDIASPLDWRVKKMDGKFESKSKDILARTPLSIKDSCSKVIVLYTICISFMIDITFNHDD